METLQKQVVNIFAVKKTLSPLPLKSDLKFWLN